MEKSKQVLKNHPELKVDERLNLGLDADQSSEEQTSRLDQDDNQQSGGSERSIVSPLDEK